MDHVAEKTTYFAPAGRASPASLRAMQGKLYRVPLLDSVLDVLPVLVLLLNEERQIIAASRLVCDLYKKSREEILGLRPGELIKCANCQNGPDGCGTSWDCSVCGAVTAVLESQETDQSICRECQVMQQDHDALDLRVTASPLLVAGDKYTCIVIEDIGDTKRRQVLEHTFFHDTLNLTGGILGLGSLLSEMQKRDDQDSRECLDAMMDASRQLLEEIEIHRDLVYAEAGELKVLKAPVNVDRLLQDLHRLYSHHHVGKERRIKIDNGIQDALYTDGRILGRVLGNMIKNALEATEAGGCITIACESRCGEAVFSVHNAMVMPDDVQLQIFKRSFSTKGAIGRGIGTHSMKLFGEKYLGGKVGFTSRAPEGTVFTLTLPKEDA